MWQRQFRSVDQANDWSEKQSPQVLAACLSGWAPDEFYAAMNRYQRSLEDMLNHPKGRLSPYRSKCIWRGELKSSYHGAEKSLAEIAKRIRIVGNSASPEIPPRQNERSFHEQFLEGFYDQDVQAELLKEPEQEFLETLK